MVSQTFKEEEAYCPLWNKFSTEAIWDKMKGTISIAVLGV